MCVSKGKEVSKSPVLRSSLVYPIRLSGTNPKDDCLDIDFVCPSCLQFERKSPFPNELTETVAVFVLVI